ncbi:MAG: hypothetical protein ACYTFW_00860 [Planctomycetota bacterium]|jgi:hypothetical protein
MSGGGSESTSFKSSHEQKRLFKEIFPMIQALGRQGKRAYGQPGYGAPQLSGLLSDIPMYEIPDVSMAQPTKQWWEGLDPGVKKGLYAPYEEAGDRLTERLGSMGAAGSAQGGASGAIAGGLGELEAEAAKNVGLSAWKMTQPSAMANWQANLMRNQQGYNVAQQEVLADYNTAVQGWQMPFALTGQMPHALPQGVVTPGAPSNIPGIASGAMGGALAGGQVGGPWGAVAGGVLGGLSGIFSEK